MSDLIAAIRVRRDARSSVHRHEGGRTVYDLLFEADHDLHLLLAAYEELEGDDTALLASQVQYWRSYAQRLEAAASEFISRYRADCKKHCIPLLFGHDFVERVLAEN